MEEAALENAAKVIAEQTGHHSDEGPTRDELLRKIGELTVEASADDAVCVGNPNFFSLIAS